MGWLKRRQSLWFQGRISWWLEFSPKYCRLKVHLGVGYEFLLFYCFKWTFYDHGTHWNLKWQNMTIWSHYWIKSTLKSLKMTILQLSDDNISLGWENIRYNVLCQIVVKIWMWKINLNHKKERHVDIPQNVKHQFKPQNRIPCRYTSQDIKPVLLVLL